jgi:translation machinery-associated protein 16
MGHIVCNRDYDTVVARLTFLVLRIKSFQSYTTEHESPLSVAEIQAMIEDYLGRDDEDLAKLKAERRAGRPPATRQTLLELQRNTEQGEYASGFWVPDLEDVDNLRKLKEWNGQWAQLAILKFARITKEGLKKESSFPPKGMS